MADPIGTVASLYRSYGEEVSAEHAQRMTAQLADTPKDAFGRHRYDPADFGWTYQDIGAEFEDYTARYSVSAETPEAAR
jgi:hypothetical protein